MRGRVAVLFLLLLSSLPLFADCNWMPRYSAQFRTTALDVSTSGGFVWVATAYGVQLLDTNGEILDSIALPGITRVVQTSSSDLTYAGSGSQIYALRRIGDRISIAGVITAAGTVNALLVSGSYLFAATSNGIEHYNLFDPAHPSKTNATLITTSPNVTALAVTRNVLYAADGDDTIETFTVSVPSIPQGTGSIETVQRATAVHATSDGYVFVSDRFGQNTDMINGTTRVARVPYGATAFAASDTPFVHFIAGPDRTLRAVDFSSFAKIAERFESQLAPTDGTDNVIHALERAGDTLYVAAGDIGLIRYDVGDLARPYPLVSYASGPTASVVVDGNRAWFADATGKISEQTIDANGVALSETRNWQTISGAAVRDVRANVLLVTSGARAQLWNVAGNPAQILDTTFAETITNAVLVVNRVVVRLANGQIWSVRANETPSRMTLPPIALLARSNSVIVFAEIRENDGATVLHLYDYLENGDIIDEAHPFTVNGATTGSIAIAGTRMAVFTFQGIHVIDTPTGATRLIPGSDRAIPRQLLFSGDDLLALDTRRLFVYDDARTLVREHYLPADAIAAAANGAVAVLATNEGVAASVFAAQLPVAQGSSANRYYSKVVRGGDRVYLQAEESIDIFSTETGEAPRSIGSIRAPGVIDVAANAAALFTLSGSGTISAWSPAGALLAQRSLDEGPDAQPLAIFTVGNAVWVSLSRNCSSGNCEKRTVVLDAANLNATSSMPGGAEQVVAAANRAFALFDLPSSLRAIDITDPLHPATLASVARPNASRSIAFDGALVQVLADKLYAFNQTTLEPAGERLDAMPSNATQQITIGEQCAVITGRGEQPLLFSLPSWVEATPLEVPSPVISAAQQDDRLLLLTGHSLEIWATGNVERPGKRRAVR